MTKWDILLVETRQHASGVEEYRVRRMIEKGKLGPNDLIRVAGQGKWIRVADIEDSMWQDRMPSAEERQQLRERRATTKEETPPRKTTQPAEPDAHAETVPVEISLPPIDLDDAVGEGGFKINREMEPPEDEETRKPRIAPPPLRRVRVEDDDEQPLSLGKPRKSEDLDLTSMVDVTFLLILFFMVTASYALQKSLEVPTPDKQETAQQSQSMDDLRDDNIIIDILDDNTVLLNDRPVPIVELVELIRREVRETDLNEVIIRASGSAFHETVVTVFDAANEVGVQRIRLATTNTDNEPPG